MKRLVGIGALGATLTFSAAAAVHAQQPSSPPPPVTNQADTRSATTTTSGTTGLWYVPTSEVLPAGKWSLSLYRTNTDDGQGFTDVSTFPATFAFGLGDRAELFGNLVLDTRIDRDSRPLFFTAPPSAGTHGVGGGILVNYPLVREQWIGNKMGDFWLGGKVNLAPHADSPVGIAARAMIKLPVGDKDSGASTGKSDFQLDGIVSTRNDVVELSGYGGVIVRGNPDGYKLTNGLRWGIGAASPQRYNLGFRLTAEVFGEQYFNDVITAPAGLTGVDGSIVPTSTTLKNPIVTLIGVTWSAPNGFFIGAATSLNVTMKGRNEAGFPDTPKDDKAFEVRIGFHPGARSRTPMRTVSAPSAPTRTVSAPSTPVPSGAAAPPSAGPALNPGAVAGPGAPGAVAGPEAAGPAVAQNRPPQNRPPTVRASCNPCTVEVGRSATVTADAQDPDGDPLTYRWTNGAGQMASPTSRQSTWTAPMQPGPVPFTVTVNDGRGGTASDSVTIQVTQLAARQYNFEDVHFEFDRYTLRPDALSVLDEAVSAMRGSPELRLQIEGHTCNIGTAEYNLALGARRAQAVRDYLTSKGIDAGRLTTVSYGEERPQFDNSREDTRRMNRRAALVVRLQ